MLMRSRTENQDAPDEPGSRSGTGCRTAGRRIPRPASMPVWWPWASRPRSSPRCGGLPGRTAPGWSICSSRRRSFRRAELLAALSDEYGIPFWEELPTDHIDTGFTAPFSIQYLKKQKMVPLDTPQGFVVAVNDPSNFQAADDLCRLLGLPERPVVLATQEAIHGGDQPRLRPEPEHGQGVLPGDARRSRRTASSPRSRRRATCSTRRATPRSSSWSTSSSPGRRRTGRAISTSSPTRPSSRSATGSTASSTTS